MQRSYLDYAMSVIVGRALPDVRDGLKPVHRKILYAMYDSGFRPDRGYVKCARVVGDVMGNYHPHGDSSIYDALVRMGQPWSLRYPLIDGNGNFGSPGNDPPAAMRYTESKLAPLAMEMLRDIDEDTVDMQDNYDGRTQEPTILPARFPNLLVNGSEGIAVGMATKIPPHNLREIAAAVQWCLDHPEADEATTLEALLEIVKGPDFPTRGLIVGSTAIQDAYRTGRGSIRMRAVVEVEEDARGRPCLVVTELPYQVNPDNLAERVAELVKEGKLTGIADIRDESSGRTGMRLILVLKRDAVAKVVLNNLYKHTQLQETFGANMLALVDGVPRTLNLAQFIRYYVDHQIEVIRPADRVPVAQGRGARAHPARPGQGAGRAGRGDRADPALADASDEARTGLIQLLDIDEVQAGAILDMQLRRLAALERQKIIDELAKIEIEIADLKDILAKPERQRAIVSEELRRDRPEVRRRPAHPDHPVRRRGLDGGPHRARGRCGDDHTDRLREAHQGRHVPLAEARRQGCERRLAAPGRHRQPLLRHLYARLDPVLHEQGPGLPGEGVRAAGGQPVGQGPARREPAGVPARRAHRPGHPDPELPGRAVPCARH